MKKLHFTLSHYKDVNDIAYFANERAKEQNIEINSLQLMPKSGKDSDYVYPKRVTYDIYINFPALNADCTNCPIAYNEAMERKEPTTIHDEIQKFLHKGSLKNTIEKGWADLQKEKEDLERRANKLKAKERFEHDLRVTKEMNEAEKPFYDELNKLSKEFFDLLTKTEPVNKFDEFKKELAEKIKKADEQFEKKQKEFEKSIAEIETHTLGKRINELMDHKEPFQERCFSLPKEISVDVRFGVTNKDFEQIFNKELELDDMVNLAPFPIDTCLDFRNIKYIIVRGKNDIETK